ncbi:MAG TPA: hypothetical protein PKA95_08500 [Thermomicrobiales bacterium]|nr:hypothetical protein [Thermomicrobiales bacterium]
MTRTRAIVWALAGLALCELYRRTRWSWARRLEDAVYRRHQAATKGR